MKIPISKLKAILLYFSENTDPKFLGKVKLMNLFYFLDFTHVKKYGMPVTFDRYVNLEHGPIPSVVKNLVDDASENSDYAELADTIDFETPRGTNMFRVVSRRKLSDEERKMFSETELEVLLEVCQRFGNKNTDFIEEASHNEAPWKETSLLDDIPYSLASHDSDSVSTEEEINFSMKVL